jgi:Domain of unknown function (DUF362)
MIPPPLVLASVLAAMFCWPSFASNPSPDNTATSSTNALVIITHDPLATDAYHPSLDRVRGLLDRGLKALTRKPNTREAWASLLTLKDIVGIKVHSAPGLAGTRPEVAAAIAESLIDFGLPRDHIVVWDKQTSDLQSSGFLDLARQYGIRVASGHQAKYDESLAYTNSTLGHLTWTDHEFEKTGEDVGKRSFFNQLVTRQLTRIINVAPLMNHYRAGVSGCLYSLAMGSIDNTQRFEASAERLADAIPEVFAHEVILDKVVLHVVDALLAQYQGESSTLLHYAKAINELRFSKDPVALDTLSLNELEFQRRAAESPYPTNAAPFIHRLYFENAPLLELGIADPTKIRLERK